MNVQCVLMKCNNDRSNIHYNIIIIYRLGQAHNKLITGCTQYINITYKSITLYTQAGQWQWLHIQQNKVWPIQLYNAWELHCRASPALCWCWSQAALEEHSNYSWLVLWNMHWGLPNWELQYRQWNGPALVACEWLMFSGPRLGRGRGRGLVGVAHVWRSEGVKCLRGVVRICVVSSGTGSMPHSRSWWNRVSCTGKTPEVGRCGRKLEEWAWMGKLGRQVHVHWDTTDHSTTHAYY